MVVAYGDRTAETSGSYDDVTAAAAVAAFMIARGEHWLMAVQPRAELNVSTARLLTLDLGEPLGNLTQVAANVFEREFANGTVHLDCNHFAGSFEPRFEEKASSTADAAAAAADDDDDDDDDDDRVAPRSKEEDDQHQHRDRHW